MLEEIERIIRAVRELKVSADYGEGYYTETKKYIQRLEEANESLLDEVKIAKARESVWKGMWDKLTKKK